MHSLQYLMRIGFLFFVLFCLWQVVENVFETKYRIYPILQSFQMKAGSYNKK